MFEKALADINVPTTKKSDHIAGTFEPLSAKAKLEVVYCASFTTIIELDATPDNLRDAAWENVDIPADGNSTYIEGTLEIVDIRDENGGPVNKVRTMNLTVEVPEKMSPEKIQLAILEAIRLGRHRMERATQDPEAQEFLQVKVASLSFE